MKLLVSKTLLLKALEGVTGSNYIVDGKEDSSILIYSDNYTLTIVGGNSENRCEMVLPADVEETGEIIIASKDIDKRIKGIPTKDISVRGNENFIFFEAADSETTKSSYSTKFEACESDKFTDFDEVKNIELSHLNAGELSVALACAISAADKKAIKPEIRNVCMSLDSGKISFVGLSSLNLQRYTFDGCKPEISKTVVIPYDGCKNIAKILKKNKNTVEIFLQKNNLGYFLVVKTHIGYFYLKVLSSKYPDYSCLCDISHADSCVSFNTNYLRQLVNSISGIRKGSSISFILNDLKQIEMSAADVSIVCTGDVKGNFNGVSFEAKPFKDMLSVMSAEQCTIYIVRDCICVIQSSDGKMVNVNSLIK